MIALGKYTIRIVLRPDNPAFPRYQIFLGAKLIALQFSMPCLSDCDWHAARKGVYASPEETARNAYGYSERSKVRRGRPTNEERGRRASYLSQVEEEINR